MITFQGDPDQVRATGSTTISLSGDLKGLLGRVAGVQEALRVALVSPGAGNSAQTQLTKVGVDGNALSATLDEVGGNLGITATKTADQDVQASSGINAAAGSTKVDTQSWA